MQDQPSKQQRMKRISLLLGGLKFLLVGYLKKVAYLLIRIASIPLRLAFSLTQPDPRKLGYEDLLRLCARYSAKAWQTSDAGVYEMNYAGQISGIASLYGSRRLLEIGCGFGLAAKTLQQAGFEVSANDVVDALDPAVRQTGVNFLQGDICRGLTFPDAAFDLVFSVNSFEHFFDPPAALDEFLRMTRPGGLIYLTFDPLYYSPWGLHAARRLGFPYPQILFNDGTIQQFVDEKADEIVGTYDPSSDRTKIGPQLNRWTVEQYRQTFKRRKAALKIIFYAERTSLAGLGMLATHLSLFKANSQSFSNLTTNGITILARKM
jgi:SAM-dependent methyltransferase